jgi:putative methylase
MGEHAQRRIIRKLDLERFLSTVKIQPNPKVQLEQYTVSEELAANVLYIAAYTNGDVVGKSVLDLACGTGRLALGASFLGADTVVGVDIDRSAIKTAVENRFNAGVDNVEWVLGDIKSIAGRFDTVLQNPPFGVQNREADRTFLVKAIEVALAVYSLHNHPEFDENLIRRLKSVGRPLQVQPSPFLERFIVKNGGAVLGVYAMLMTIPKMFDFHTKVKHDFVIDLYVIKKSTCRLP